MPHGIIARGRQSCSKTAVKRFFVACLAAGERAS
jgi:hypothetical protein